MTLKTTLLAGTVLGMSALAAGPAAAQATQGQIDALNKQIEALQAQVRTLADKVQKDVKAVDEKVSRMPNVSADGGRLRVRSADKAFDVAIRSRFHLDYGHWFPDNDNDTDYNDGFNVRRARLGVAGTVFGDWGFEFTGDFAGERGSDALLQAANISYRGLESWEFIVGLAKPKWGLEDSTSSNDIPFMERAPVVNIVTGNVGGADSRLLAGSQYSGERVFAAAYLTGARTGEVLGDDEGNVLGRVAVKAWEDNFGTLGIGATGAYKFAPQAPAGDAASLRFDDRPAIRIGANRDRVTRSGTIGDVDSAYAYGADLAFTYQSFWAGAEYYRFGAETDNAVATAATPVDPEYSGWYAAAGYVLTGERRGYRDGAWRGVTPAWPAGQNGVGAVELVARYSVVDLSDVGAFGSLNQGGLNGEETIWTFGVNWYANSAIRFMLNYLMIENDRPGALPDVETDAVGARVQFQF
ncbi:OprO/OprP family phosphate-selective porin [Indioceanicola profundi]|uniref:OprO/OprP family phosphate-selective porin n=1 Tax=Indioceanicola profundi TaxID=2220096 RepID=UPI000E6ABB5C|nr:porin [Indioceanicola profundi]